MALVETQHELSTVQHALKAYEVVGVSFESLVEEYTALTSEIENKKWAIQELVNSEESQSNCEHAEDV